MASMGLRTITYTVTPTGITPCTEQDGGVQGEHHITDVVFSLSSELQTKLAAQETAGYTVAYRLDGVDGAGGYYASELLTPADGVLTFPLPRELTGAGGSVRLNLVIAASRENDSGQAVEEMTLYTYTARLRLANSAYGAQGRTAFTQEFSQEITGALAQLQGIQDTVEDAVVHGPKIEDGTWWVWNFDTGGYVDTGVETAAAVYTAELDGINYRYDVTTARYAAAEDIAEGTALLVYVTQGNAPWANLYVDGLKVGSHDGMVTSQYNGGNLYNPGGADDTAKAKGFDQEGYYLCRYTGTYWETRRVGDQYSQAETDALLAGKADAVQGVYYGEDTNAASLKERPVTVDESFVLETGAAVRIKFVNGVYVSAATLDVNGTGAKPLQYRGAHVVTGRIQANEVVSFVYDGACWCVVGQMDTDALVSQNTATDDGDYRLLLSGFAVDTGQNTVAKKNGQFTANPATGVLSAKSFAEDGTALSDKYAAKAANTLPVISGGSTAEAPQVLTDGTYYCTVTSSNAYLDISQAPGHVRILHYSFGSGIYLQNGTTPLTINVVNSSGAYTAGATNYSAGSDGGFGQFAYSVADIYKIGDSNILVIQSPKYPTYTT